MVAEKVSRSTSFIFTRRIIGTDSQFRAHETSVSLLVLNTVLLLSLPNPIWSLVQELKSGEPTGIAGAKSYSERVTTALAYNDNSPIKYDAYGGVVGALEVATEALQSLTLDTRGTDDWEKGQVIGTVISAQPQWHSFGNNPVRLTIIQNHHPTIKGNRPLAAVGCPVGGLLR